MSGYDYPFWKLIHFIYATFVVLYNALVAVVKCDKVTVFFDVTKTVRITAVDFGQS